MPYARGSKRELGWVSQLILWMVRREDEGIGGGRGKEGQKYSQDTHTLSGNETRLEEEDKWM